MANKDFRPFKAFAVNLAKARIEANLTQETLALRAGISLRHYQGMESGHRCPSLETLVQLKAVLKISLDDLAEGMPVKPGLDEQNDRPIRLPRILNSLPAEKQEAIRRSARR